MKNITQESEDISNQMNQQMPTIKDFASAKLADGFNIIGTKFGQGAKKLNLKKDLITKQAQLNNTLAKQIGTFVIGEINNGNTHDISIPQDFVDNVLSLQSEIDGLKFRFKNT